MIYIYNNYIIYICSVIPDARAWDPGPIGVVSYCIILIVNGLRFDCATCSASGVGKGGAGGAVAPPPPPPPTFEGGGAMPPLGTFTPAIRFLKIRNQAKPIFCLECYGVYKIVLWRLVH